MKQLIYLTSTPIQVGQFFYLVSTKDTSHKYKSDAQTGLISFSAFFINCLFLLYGNKYQTEAIPNPFARVKASLTLAKVSLFLNLLNSFNDNHIGYLIHIMIGTIYFISFVSYHVNNLSLMSKYGDAEEYQSLLNSQLYSNCFSLMQVQFRRFFTILETNLIQFLVVSTVTFIFEDDQIQNLMKKRKQNHSEDRTQNYNENEQLKAAENQQDFIELKEDVKSFNDKYFIKKQNEKQGNDIILLILICSCQTFNNYGVNIIIQRKYGIQTNSQFSKNFFEISFMCNSIGAVLCNNINRQMEKQATLDLKLQFLLFFLSFSVFLHILAQGFVLDQRIQMIGAFVFGYAANSSQIICLNKIRKQNQELNVNEKLITRYTIGFNVGLCIGCFLGLMATYLL